MCHSLVIVLDKAASGIKAKGWLQRERLVIERATSLETLSNPSPNILCQPAAFWNICNVQLDVQLDINGIYPELHPVELQRVCSTDWRCL